MKRRHFIGLISSLLPGIAVARIETNKRQPAGSIPIQHSPIAGFQFHQGEALWSQLAIGQPLTLVREPDNRYDPRAVRIDWQGHKVGYLPRTENGAVSQMLDRGQRLEASITNLRQSRNPWQRLTVEVHAVLTGHEQPASL